MSFFVRALSPLIAALCLLTAPASAQVTWDGGGDGSSWSSAANWSTDTVPGPTDDVVIPAGATPVNITTDDVTIRSLSLARTLNVNGNRTLSVTDAATSTAQLGLSSGASLSGGTWNLNTGSSLVLPARCAPPARLSNLTINGNIANFSGFTRWSNVTLNGTLTASATANAEIALEGNQTLTGTFVGNLGTLFFTPFSAGTLTIAPSAIIRGGRISFEASSTCVPIAAFSVVNNGTIEANVVGQRITFGAGVPVTNNGTITSPRSTIQFVDVLNNTASGNLSIAGGNLILGPFTNAGSISVGAGSVTFNNDINPLQLGAFTGVSNTWYFVKATADLAGQSWTPVGFWRIDGTLQNGTVNLSTATIRTAGVCSSPAPRFSNLTINGNLSTFNGYVRWNNVTLNGTLNAISLGSLGSAYSAIVFEGEQTLTGTFTTNTDAYLHLVSSATGTLTIAPSAVLGDGFFFFSHFCTPAQPFSVINNGTFSSTRGTVSTAPTVDFTNNGSITHRSPFTFVGPFRNTATGTIFSNQSTLRLDSIVNDGGTITGSNASVSLGNLNNQGTINLTGGAATFTGTLDIGQLGTLTNTGSTIIDAAVDLAGRTWVVPASTTINGTIESGTLQLPPSPLTFSASCATTARLSNVTLNGTNPTIHGFLRWNNVTWNGTLTVSGGLAMEGDQTLSGSISVPSRAFGGSLIVGPASTSTLTLAPDFSLSGTHITIAGSTCFGTHPFSIINNGTITATGGSAGITLSSTMPFVNNGQITANSTRVTFTGGLTNSASGLITANAAEVTFGTFTNAGSIALTAGTATYGGVFNPNQLGNFVSTANSVLTGVTDLNGQTWNMAGTWRIDGTVQNGELTTSAASVSFTIFDPPARLSNITINGNLPAFAGSVRWNNVTLNGTLTVRDSGTIAFDGDQTLTGTIVSTTSFFDLVPSSAGTLTIAPSSIIRGAVIFNGTGPSGLQAFSVVNQGTIDLTGPSRLLDTSANVTFINATSGRISGTNATAFFGPLENLGIITLSGGTATFFSTFNPNQLGSYTNTGVSSIAGTADLDGQTWAPQGSWVNQGTIQNGTVDLSSGQLGFSDSCSPTSRLSNLTLNGDIPTFTGRFRWNNVILNGTITATGTAEIAFEGNQTLSGTVVSNSTSNLALTPFTTGTLTIPPSASIRGGNITFASSSICRGPRNFAVVNNGNITADTASRTITVNADVPFTNNATVAAGPGNIQFSGTLTNAAGASVVGNNANVTFAAINNSGAIALAGGTATFSGPFTPNQLGNFSNTGTTVLNGAVNLAGQTWTVSGPVRINNSLQNGTLQLAGGSLTFPSVCTTPARISDLTINGAAATFSGAVRWNNITLTTTLAANADSEILFEGNQTLTGTLAGATSAQLELLPFTAGTLTIAPSASLRGGNIRIGRTRTCRSALSFNVINNGTLSATTAFRTISVNADVPFTNNGSVIAGPGALQFNGAITNYIAATNTLSGGTWRAAPGGIIRFATGTAIRTIASGTSVILDDATANFFSANAVTLASLTTINGTLELLSGRDFTAAPIGGTFTNNGTLALSPGSLFTVNGNFVQTASGTLASTINGTSPTNFGALFATGSVTLAGTVTANLVSTFAPNGCSSSFGILSAAGTVSGAFATQSFLGTQPPSAAAIAYTTSTATLVLSSWADIVSIGGFPPGDGLLTGDDFVAFINAFAAQEPLGDITGIGGPPSPRDGQVTPDDFVAFVNSFAAGCP